MAQKYNNGYVKINRLELSLREQRRLELRDWNKRLKPTKRRLTKKQRRRKLFRVWAEKYKGYSYRRLLFTPEWKSFRARILKRDNHECKKCGSKYRLQVHHIKYGEYMFPWVVKDLWVITLCYKCHKAIHTNLNHNACKEKS